jgi:hypothetical protein
MPNQLRTAMYVKRKSKGGLGVYSNNQKVKSQALSNI